MHVIKIATFYNSGLLRLEVASAAKEKAKLAKAALLRLNIDDSQKSPLFL